MTKRKKRIVDEVVTEEHQEFIDRKFGEFTVRVTPFPTGLFEKLASQSEQKFPYPAVPEKEIETFGENEIIQDTEDEEWLKQKKLIDEQRKKYSGTIVFQYMLDSCLEVLGYDQMLKKIKRLEKIGIEFDPDNLQGDFITSHLVRTQSEYTMLITDSLGLTIIGDQEVAERLNSFQDNMERQRTVNIDPSGSEGEPVQSSDERVEVVESF